MSEADALPRLHALHTYVRSPRKAQAFWERHFGLPLAAEGADFALPAAGGGEMSWRLWPGGEACGTRGPHFALPAFAVADFGAARGYLHAQGIPIVFEEMLPGANLLIFLDPDANPFELIEITSPQAWDLGQRRELRTRRRQDAAPAAPLTLGPLQELTIYAHDITASGRFYRDLVGLPAGLSFFGHLHLAAANVQVVVRSTHWRCKAPQQPHGSEPVFLAANLAELSARLQAAGYAPDPIAAPGLAFTDPAGLRVHFTAA